VKDIVTFFLKQVNGAEVNDQVLENKFSESSDKPVCIEYQIEITNNGFETITNVKFGVEELDKPKVLQLDN
jgi:hypothetical protein